MEEVIYFNNLYDLYGCLLTEKQRKYFEDYYFNNLTLGEMAENYNVSRNAIFKQIKITTDKLIFYEDKLNYYKKLSKLTDVLNKEEDNNLKENIEKIFY